MFKIASYVMHKSLVFF